MPKKDNWTPEMYEQLAELYQKFTKPEIHAMTGWGVKEMTYRTHKMGIIKGNRSAQKLAKIENIDDVDQFLIDNYNRYTNKELMQLLGFKLYQIRRKCYELGLYRMTLEYWTPEQEAFLRESYHNYGDKELSQIFQEKWPKEKEWTLKHIEKKRGYLGLKRTPAEISAIRDRNVELGVFALGAPPRWIDRGVTKDGDIRMGRIHNGRYVPYIKVDGNFVLWSRHTWEQVHGPVPEGMMVVFKNDPSEYVNGIESLELTNRLGMVMKMVEKAGRGLSDNYIAAQLTYQRPELREAIKQMPELLDIKRKELLLTRAIKLSKNGKTK